MTEPLTDREAEIVRLIDAGLVRWKIAELLGVGASSVRAVVVDLCERYDCRMDDLPTVTRTKWDDGDDCPVCGAELDDDNDVPAAGSLRHPPGVV